MYSYEWIELSTAYAYSMTRQVKSKDTELGELVLKVLKWFENKN